jgi:hypothetical protein
MRSSRKCCEASLAGADGVVFLVVSIGKPPRPLLRLRAVALALRGDQRMLRDIFLIARPPLLAVMQGGDSCLIPIYSQSRFRNVFLTFLFFPNASCS